MNRVFLLGNLGGDPESKTLPSGDMYCTFSLATSENYKDKDGNKQTKKNWSRIVSWGKTAELASKFLSKGRQVLVEGKLSHRSYEKNGVKMNTSEVVASGITFLGAKESRNEPALVKPAPQKEEYNPGFACDTQVKSKPIAELFDDIPF